MPVSLWTTRSIDSLWRVRRPPGGSAVSFSISVLSVDWDRWAVLAPANPTADLVKFAYKAPGSGDPILADWVPGTWESTVLSTGEYVARCLVGPGNKVLARGNWDVWIQIGPDSGSGTTPVFQVGVLQVT